MGIDVVRLNNLIAAADHQRDGHAGGGEQHGPLHQELLCLLEPHHPAVVQVIHQLPAVLPFYQTQA